MSTVDPMEARCVECGDRKPLGPDGRCVWRHGCEHRQLVERARLADVDRCLAILEEDPALAQEGDWTVGGEELLALVEVHLERMTYEAQVRGLIPPGYRLSIDLSPLLDDE